ncbi:hypothetical protein CEXT_245421 [Caerostris extrusa]|uniref:Uncharacterized protein n=1 Tax=Caerostris extrusa TaxID=172846 RepID=A0AAV4YAH0_CAEEX|nr:hypothetical protein CEXT_245421 [Caerostris extrusa]
MRTEDRRKDFYVDINSHLKSTLQVDASDSFSSEDSFRKDWKTTSFKPVSTFIQNNQSSDQGHDELQKNIIFHLLDLFSIVIVQLHLFHCELWISEFSKKGSCDPHEDLKIFRNTIAFHNILKIVLLNELLGLFLFVTKYVKEEKSEKDLPAELFFIDEVFQTLKIRSNLFSTCEFNFLICKNQDVSFHSFDNSDGTYVTIRTKSFFLLAGLRMAIMELFLNIQNKSKGCGSKIC